MSLQQIQEHLVAPKNQFNNFGKYKYRNLEDILEALKPLLAKYQYSLVINDTIEQIGERFYIKATASLYDDKMSLITHSSAYAREELSKKGMDSAQLSGATSSYARKYCLNGLFLIDDNRDADTVEAKNVPMVTDEQIKYIYTMITTKGIDKDAVKKAYSVESLKDLTAEQALILIEQLKKK